MRLYLDTSVFGGYFNEEFAAETRKLFKEIFERKHQIYISEITRDELNTAPEQIQNLLLHSSNPAGKLTLYSAFQGSL